MLKEPQLDIGLNRCIDLCPKHIGMVMLLRSMAPRVIITDEIATKGYGSMWQQIQALQL